jgi:squalene-hopene/tetraprenyl-beta-curcumene cyclase
LTILALSFSAVRPLGAAETAVNASRQYEQMVSKAIDFLATKGQAENGAFSAQAGPGVTALITFAILRHGRSPDDPLVAKSLKYLETFVRADGGVCPKESLYGNYETCLAIMCFTEANRDGRYAQVIKRAEAFVKEIQWDEGESKERSDLAYGGAGYGNKKRPDLSNTSFLIDALKTAGGNENDEAIKKALIFVSRCQNLETEHNTTPFAAKSPDGGFYYTAAAGGSSMAGETPEGGLRSYGSMTYAGLKSMIYAGVGPDDPRVKAAVTWIRKHYDVTSNPGMGNAGLYYYYQTFAKALAAMKIDQLQDDNGVQHDWRAELQAQLAKQQLANGSWTNETDRWYEGDPNLVTGYALLALSYCRSK